MDAELDFDTEWLFPRRAAAFLNLWYRTYDEAKDALVEHPDRFLFPYRNQFVVCEGSLLEHLGVDTNDPDWALLGHDWHCPPDLQARQRLGTLLKSKLKPPEKERNLRRSNATVTRC